MEHQAIWRHGNPHRDSMMDGRNAVENDKRESGKIGIKGNICIGLKIMFQPFYGCWYWDYVSRRKMRIWSWRKRKEKQEELHDEKLHWESFVSRDVYEAFEKSQI